MIKLIHISGHYRWCGPSSAQTSAVSGYDYLTNERTAPGVAADLAPLGVVFIDVLIDGFDLVKPATFDDRRGWVGDHHVNLSVLDAATDPSTGSSSPPELARFFTAAEAPWNAEIDARSMQILNLSFGFSDSASFEGPLGHSGPAASWIAQVRGRKRSGIWWRELCVGHHAGCSALASSRVCLRTDPAASFILR